MLHVVHPLGLFALGAIAIPFVLHLRRRPLRVVRVGSLRPFLAHPRPARARTLRDWPMLLLRCALLVALALALAGLQWAPRTAAPARWALLLPGTALQDSHRQAWQARLAEGFEARWLAPGYPRMTDRTDRTDRTNPPSPDTLPRVWPLLAEADQQLPSGSEAWVFGPTWTFLFEGRRPSVAKVRIHWHAVPLPPPVFAPPTVPRVAIVHSPSRLLDAGYLHAALQAMGASVVTNEVASWIFQLGSAPLPRPLGELARHGVRIVRDAPEDAEPRRVSRRIDVGVETIALRQRVAAGPGAPLFRDSQGEAWLSEEQQGAVRIWHVAFRFHPSWTDWPLDGAFPAWWLEHLQPGPPNTTALAPEQAAPRFVPDPDRNDPSTMQLPPPIDLRAGCWGLGVALFAVERLLSRRSTQARGSNPIVAGVP
jgi:hypothetical protein